MHTDKHQHPPTHPRATQGTCWAAKGVRKGLELTEGSEDAEAGRRVLICEERSELAGLLLLLAPGLAHSNKEELALQRIGLGLGHKRLPRELDPAQVRDRLHTLDKPTVFGVGGWGLGLGDRDPF
jgi:hypothetical protein